MMEEWNNEEHLNPLFHLSNIPKSSKKVKN